MNTIRLTVVKAAVLAAMLLATLLLVPSNVSAADITATDCKGRQDCLVIAIQGDIEPNDDAHFVGRLMLTLGKREIKTAIVTLASPVAT